MNKITSFAICTIAVFSLSILEKTSAQTSIVKPIGNPMRYINRDSLLMADFDEQAVLNSFAKKGYAKEEYYGAMKWAKYEYLMKKKGITPKISFPQKSMMSAGCNNVGVEDTTFTNWVGATGSCSGMPTIPPTWVPGIVSTTLNSAECDAGARHTIMTNSAGFDANAISMTTNLPEIPLTAPGGGGVSIRLGNAVNGAQTEKLDYLINVTPTNTAFTLQYAVVLEFLPSHLFDQQPSFNIRILDSLGNAITSCGAYSVQALAAAADTTFHPFAISTAPCPNILPPATIDGYYRKWTMVGIDLSAYIGHPVTIEFQTSDCTQAGHFGYAYIDASCAQLQAQSFFCLGDTSAVMNAPSGFALYQWYNGATAIPGATSSSYTVNNPVLGQIYTVQMTSLTGCGTSLSVTLAYSNMTAINNTIPVSCFGLNNGSSTVIPSGAAPPFNYSWVSSSGGPVISTTNSITGMGPGTYYATISTNGGCFVVDTINIFAPADDNDTILNITTNFCPLDSFLTLNAPSGSNYYWFDPSGNQISGATSSSLVITNPIVGQVYIVGYDPGTTQCRKSQSDTLVYSVLTGNANVVNNVSCYGLNDGSATANATSLSGPYTYTWVNSAGATVSTTQNLNSATAGTYTVTVATSPGGCEYQNTVTITQPGNPNDSIHLTTTFCLEDKNIVLRVPSGLGTYAWYESDTSLTGIVLSTYDTLLVADPVVGNTYTVLIHPPFGCDYLISSTLKYSPPPNLPNYFITSNVFTPDGDGINDKFDVSLDPLTSRASTLNGVTTTTANEFAYVKDFKIEIYNRWGKKVFESSDVHTQWDGRINGNPAEEGVYYWIASFTSLCTPDGEPHESTGFVQVVKKGS